MRDRHKLKDRHPRLIESHWNMEDEFVNLSVPSDRVDAGSSLSYRLLPPALVLLLVAAAIVVIKVFIDKGKAETKKQETRLVTKSTKRRQQATCISPVKRTKLSVSTTTTTAVAETTEPSLVKELKNEEVFESNTDDHEERIACHSIATSTSITIVGSEDVALKATTNDGPITNAATVTNTTSSSAAVVIVKHNLAKEQAIELAEKIKVTTEIFEQQGLDVTRAHDFVLQRHLSELQEQSRRDYENEKLTVELKLRSVELEMTERRHRESLATQRMDPNWVTKCFAARDSVLEYTITATVSLLCAVTIDQLCKSGMDTIRSELVSLRLLHCCMFLIPTSTQNLTFCLSSHTVLRLSEPSVLEYHDVFLQFIFMQYLALLLGKLQHEMGVKNPVCSRFAVPRGIQVATYIAVGGRFYALEAATSYLVSRCDLWTCMLDYLLHGRVQESFNAESSEAQAGTSQGIAGRLFDGVRSCQGWNHFDHGDSFWLF